MVWARLAPRQEGNPSRELADARAAKELLKVPDRSTIKGKHDYCILALSVECALRRSELAALKIEDIQLAPASTPWTNRQTITWTSPISSSERLKSSLVPRDS